MENATSVAVTVYQSDNYSYIFSHYVSQLNMLTAMPAKSPVLGDIEYNEFVRRWLEFSLMICLSLIGTFGNIHTILVYARVEEMNQRFHVRTLITWLSVVDLITCFAVMPFETVTIRLNYSVSSNEACKLFRFIGHTTIMSSWLLLTVIAHERYRKIYSIFLGNHSSPKKGNKITSWLKSKSTFFQQNVVCTFIIILSVIVSSPLFVFLGIVTVPVTLNNTGLSGTQCTTHRQYRGKLTAGLYAGIVGLFGLSCFIYCSYCYGKILYLIRKQSEKEKKRKENNFKLRGKLNKIQRNPSYNKRKPNFMVTISLIAATGLSVCGFILFSIGIAIVVSESALTNAVITSVLLRGCFINNACNPVVYFIFDNQFRHACKKLYIKQT
ncbi:unnamed protein product [Mytilus edulis]|uniref:G-protein coupled receptors family 1 profile domain-containing protein n=1 Tax=Mytilus edulis TaxID=6550 RepID=A0A8S3SDZ7_MYTED|nr:unnamed protein product [Mytilus edulis]